MAFTEIYVDPSIAADSGTGTIGDPFGDLEYAIEQTTFDTTNGTRVNIKAGTDEILAAELSLAMEDTGTTVAWAPSETARCVFQGYSAAAGDGGQGGISGGGLVSIYNEATGKDYITFQDLHLHNTGANNIVTLDDYCHVINCEVNNGTLVGISVSILGSVIGCYVYNIGTVGILTSERCNVSHNAVIDGANALTIGIDVAQACTVYRNIVSVAAGNGDGIRYREACNVMNNSVYSAAGTGQGIVSFTSQYANMLVNNLVEGFSGVGGIGIDLSAADVGVAFYAGNGVYDCATAYSAGDIPSTYEADNETLTASPFTSASTNDFSPVDTGSVKEGSLPASIGNGLV